jgi:ADP-ribose pyrophosphatase YjhB (NUDIX family)
MRQDEPFRTYAGCLLYRQHRGQTEVLLVQPVGNGKKRWQMPQVEADAGEDFEEAAHRQALEETGIDADEVHLLGFVDYPNRRLFCFFGKALSSHKPETLHLEIQDARFFPLDEARQLLDKRQKQLLGALESTLMFRQNIA